jgi:hypothetical protein
VSVLHMCTFVICLHPSCKMNGDNKMFECRVTQMEWQRAALYQQGQVADTACNFTLPLYSEVDGSWVVCNPPTSGNLVAQVTIRLRGTAKVIGVVLKTMLI